MLQPVFHASPSKKGFLYQTFNVALSYVQPGMENFSPLFFKWGETGGKTPCCMGLLGLWYGYSSLPFRRWFVFLALGSVPKHPCQPCFLQISRKKDKKARAVEACGIPIGQEIKGAKISTA